MSSHRMSDHCDLISELTPTEGAGLWNERLTLTFHIGDHPLVVGGEGHKGGRLGRWDNILEGDFNIRVTVDLQHLRRHPHFVHLSI